MRLGSPPQVALVDELAHTNARVEAPEALQDVEELLEAASTW